VRVSLSRELARSGCPHANVRFSTLNEIARKLAEPVLRERNLQVIGDVVRDLFAKKAIETVRTKLTYFERIAEFRGFRTKLLATLADLHGACLTVPALIAAAKDLKKSNPNTTLKLNELALLWHAYEELLAKNGLIDRAAVTEIAAQHAQNYGTSPLIIYCLDDLPELERRFLHTFTRDRDTIAFLPWLDHPSFDFTKDFQEWYKTSDFTHEPLPPYNTSAQLLSRVQRGVPEAEVTPQGSPPLTDDSSVVFLSSPDAARECEELTREILYPAQEENEEQTLAVLMRNAHPYTDLLRSSLRRSGAQAYFHQCRTLGETTVGRTLRKFLRLLRGDYRRIDVTDFLLSGSLRVPDSLAETLAELPASEWNAFAVRAEVIAGESEWRANLRRLNDSLKWEAKRLDPEDESQADYEARLQSLNAFRNYLESLFASLKETRAQKTFSDAIESVKRHFLDRVPSDDLVDDIFLQLEQSSVADFAGIAMTPDDLANVFESALRAPAQREGRYQENEPTVAKILESRGVVFDVVHLVGMTEGEFPRRAPQDPLLLDSERQLLQQWIMQGTYVTTIPRLGDRIVHEQYLFALTVGSARKKLVCSFSRSRDNGRETLPSRYLLNAVAALHGRSADVELLYEWIDTHSCSRRVAARETPEISRAIHRHEYDTVVLQQAMQSGHSSLLSHLQDSALFMHGVETERNRFHRKEFTRFDGLIESEAAKQALREWISSEAKALSATRLESFWNCPFQWYGKQLLKLEKIEERDPLAGLDPLTRGKLLHELLEEFYRQEREAGRAANSSVDNWSRLQQFSQTKFTRFEKENPAGPYLLWQREKLRMLNQLQSFFAADCAESKDSIPEYFEWSFGGEDRGIALELPDGALVRLSGQIDRIDLDRAGALKIIDYKSGVNSRKLKSDELLDGRALQLHLYCLAAERLLEKPLNRASYFFFRADSKPRVELSADQYRKDEKRLAKVIDVIHKNVLDGKFVPWPDDTVCRRCEVRVACGAGRLTHKWRLKQTDVASYAAIREGRLDD
jgi:ATP-dependent helicase/DNAse subunit B